VVWRGVGAEGRVIGGCVVYEVWVRAEVGGVGQRRGACDDRM